MKYYIQIETINKAKQDIDAICRREGFACLTRHNFGSGGAGRFMTKLAAVASIPFRLRRGDVLFLQYPMKKFYLLACTLAKWRGARVVTVIHDLGAFRRHKLTPEQENRRLAKTDFLIVHNPTMRDYLLEHGFRGGMHCLQIFDYLSPATPATYATPHQPWRVVYAGNLGRHRNEFLYHLGGIVSGWTLDLYGKGFDAADAHCPQLAYHGFMASDDFITRAEADFGLVWDGDSTDCCTGDWGEYLRINDPHKTSFYLRAGIPVIVWREAAMAPFVESEQVGVTVSSLAEIGPLLAAMTPARYATLRQHAHDMSRHLAEGHYVLQGLAAADRYFEP